MFQEIGIESIVSLRPLRSWRLKTLVRKEQATNGSCFRQTRGSADRLPRHRGRTYVRDPERDSATSQFFSKSLDKAAASRRTPRICRGVVLSILYIFSQRIQSLPSSFLENTVNSESKNTEIIIGL